MIQTDAIGDKYDALIDRESAEEILVAKAAQASAAAADEAKAQAVADKEAALAAKEKAKADAAAAKELARQQAAAAAREAAKPSMAEKMVQSAAQISRNLRWTSVGRVAREIAGARHIGQSLQIISHARDRVPHLGLVAIIPWEARRIARTRRSECHHVGTNTRRCAANGASFRQKAADQSPPCNLRGKPHDCGKDPRNSLRDFDSTIVASGA
jgi:hypothetical protein